MRLLSPAGFSLLEGFEGLRLVAYRDIAGVWTIGYGHTGGVLKGQTVTADQAYRLLAADLRTFENFVEARTDAAATSQNQFDAMVSLAFNIGTGGPGGGFVGGGFLSSSVLRAHKDGDFAGAAKDFLLWDKAHVNGQLVVVPGLLTRRVAEAALYATPEPA